MRWVTRDRVHLDRVAAPWLIRRFIDPDADFVLLPSDSLGDLPDDATPFGLPGVELSSHDENGSTFRKILDIYGLEDAALRRLGRTQRTADRRRVPDDFAKRDTRAHEAFERTRRRTSTADARRHGRRARDGAEGLDGEHEADRRDAGRHRGIR